MGNEPFDDIKGDDSAKVEAAADRDMEAGVAETEARNRQVEEDQEKWNHEQRLKAKDEEYRAEQEKILKERELKKITPKSAAEKGEKVGKKLYNKVLDAAKDSRFAEQHDRKREELEREGYKPKKEKPVPKRLQNPSRGQFKPPGRGSGYIDPFPKGGGRGGGFPGIDPMGGMRSGGKNMLDLSFGRYGPPGPRQPAPQQPVRKQAPPRAPPQPRRNPMQVFGDPFAGIKMGAPAKAQPLAKTPNILKGMTAGGMAAKNAKVGKKLRKMDDWLKF